MHESTVDLSMATHALFEDNVEDQCDLILRGIDFYADPACVKL